MEVNFEAPFGKEFWLNPDYRNIREAICRKMYKCDHMHTYGHKVFETCACCYATKDPDELTTCYGNNCLSWSHNDTNPLFNVRSLYCNDHIYKITYTIKILKQKSYRFQQDECEYENVGYITYRCNSCKDAFMETTENATATIKGKDKSCEEVGAFEISSLFTPHKKH